MHDIRIEPQYLIKGDRGEVIEVTPTPDDVPIKIILPKQPPKKEILFHELPKKRQYWRVQEPPKALTRENKARFADFIIEEIRKTREGVWFYNNGKATYITGLHYYYLNYIKIDVGSPDYRERDRKFLYVWKVVEDHPALRGLILIKPRRMGASWLAAAILLYKLTRIKKGLGGILSKSGTDAKEFFTEKLVMAWHSLPFWLQPLTSSGTDPKTSLNFSRPAERSKKSAKEGVDNSVGLNSKIDYRPTKLRSYDSMKLIRLVYDEVGKIEGKVDSRSKWTGLNLIKQWGVLRKTLGRKKKRGVAFLPSTVGDLSEGGEQFKQLVKRSLLTNLNENGNTPSGLLAYFIPAYDGLEGFIDIYGNSIITDPDEPVQGVDGDVITIGSKTYLDNERKSITDQSELIEFKREMPYTLKEAFYDRAGESILDLGRIQTQQDWLEDVNTKALTIRGKFQWENGVRDSEVVFVEDEYGKMILTYLPDKPNQYKTRGGMRHPVNGLDFAGGVDSYDIDRTTWGSGSNGALAIFAKESANPKIPIEHKNSFVLLYLAREPKAPIFYEQVLMACIYYSTPVLIENNKPRILEYFRERGYGEYLAYRPDKAFHELSLNEKQLRGQPSNEKTIIAHGEELQNYVVDEIGIKQDGTMGRCYIYEILEDWRKFKIDNRTAYDTSVATGLALQLANKFVAQVQRISGSKRAVFKKYSYK